MITSDIFSISPITEDEVSKIVNSFPAKKASGSDGIPMRFLKLFKFSLLTHLIMIINLSFTNSIIPSLWKISKVIPIYKKGSNKDCSNFRPISLLPIFSKIMEKYVHDLLLDYMEKNKLLSDYQLGFKRRHSTIDAVLAIIKLVANSLNNKEKCVVVSLDLKKAFDTISHKILLLKLKKIGCDS
jgi:retron-type reverse transcriptase